MPKPKITDARDLAAAVLDKVRATGPFVTDVFDGLAERSGLDRRDRDLALELASGVVRHRRTLDCVLSAYASRPIVKSPPALREVVRLGAYQMLFLDRIPEHAAVNRSVELGKDRARKIGKHKNSIASFVNGLLRGIARDIERVDSSAGRDPRRVIELPGADRYVACGLEVLPDPNEDPAGHLADGWSLPPWLAERWVKRWGFARARDVARAQNRRPSTTVRVNSLALGPEKAVELLAEQGVEAKPLRPGSSMLRIISGDVLATRAMADGQIQPQDPWSATVVGRMNAGPGMRVLDRCAAPGTKTIQIAEAMRDSGQVLATDISAEGLSRIVAGCKRMHVHCVEAFDVSELPERMLRAGAADRVLIDAPCSNSGVLARRPEARWRLSAESLDEQNKLQRELLMDGLNWLAPGGFAVYSTCSVEPEENENVVKYALSRRQGEVRQVNEKLTLPSLPNDHDGGYFAVFERVR